MVQIAIQNTYLDYNTLCYDNSIILFNFYTSKTEMDVTMLVQLDFRIPLLGKGLLSRIKLRSLSYRREWAVPTPTRAEGLLSENFQAALIGLWPILLLFERFFFLGNYVWFVAPGLYMKKNIVKKLKLRRVLYQLFIKNCPLRRWANSLSHWIEFTASDM